jgi:hypothetical protein
MKTTTFSIKSIISGSEEKPGKFSELPVWYLVQHEYGTRKDGSRRGDTTLRSGLTLREAKEILEQQKNQLSGSDYDTPEMWITRLIHEE